MLTLKAVGQFIGKLALCFGIAVFVSGLALLAIWLVQGTFSFANQAFGGTTGGCVATAFLITFFGVGIAKLMENKE